MKIKLYSEERGRDLKQALIIASERTEREGRKLVVRDNGEVYFVCPTGKEYESLGTLVRESL